MPYTYSQYPAVAFYGSAASLCIFSPADILQHIWISLILCLAMFLNMAMCVHTPRAPLSAGIPANAHTPQLVSQLSALEPSASMLATMQSCAY